LFAWAQFVKSTDTGQDVPCIIGPVSHAAGRAQVGTLDRRRQSSRLLESLDGSASLPGAAIG
jgi:hypothetical protein